MLNKAEGWRNVSEHCLLEAVTADILAEGLGLAEEEREQLVAGAILHDFFKTLIGSKTSLLRYFLIAFASEPEKSLGFSPKAKRTACLGLSAK